MNFSRSLPLLVILFLFGCSKDKVSVKEDEIPAITIESIEIEGQFVLPLDNSDIGELSIISGFNQGTTRLIQQLPNQTTGEWKITLNNKAVQLVTLLNNDIPIGYSIVAPGQSNRNVINPETTAEALVFFHPLVMNNTYECFNEIIQLIQNSEGYLALVEEIRGKQTSSILEIQESSPSYFTVINELTEQLSSYFDNTSSGIIAYEISNNSNDDFLFRVVNQRKRWLNIFLESTTSSNEIKDQKLKIDDPMSEEKESYLMESFDVEILGNTYLFNERESPKLYSSVDPTIDKVSVVSYGIGIGKWEELENDEYPRLVEAMAASMIYDFIVPSVEVLTGIKNNLLKAELRGRPRNDRREELIARVVKEFSKEYIKSGFTNAALNRDQSSFLSLFFGAFVDVMQDPENFRLIKNVLRDFIPGKEALYTVKTLLPLLNKFNTVESILEINHAYLAYLMSDVKTTITFDNSPQEEGLFTVYDNLLEENGALADLAVSRDGQKIWATDGFDILQYNEGLDEFQRIPFFEEVYLADTNFPLAGVLSLDVNPINDDLYILVSVIGSQLTIPGKSRIYKYSNGDFSLVHEFQNDQDFSLQIEFDKFGNLWFNISNTDENTTVLHCLQNSGQIKPFNNSNINMSWNGTFSVDGRPIVTANVGGQRIAFLNLDGTLELQLEDWTFNNRLRQVFQDREGNLYLSTSNDDFTPSLCFYDRAKDQMSCIEEFNSIEPDFVNEIENFYEDAAGRLWFNLKLYKDKLFFISGNEIITLDSNNSNLPEEQDDNFGNWVNDIEGGVSGRTWIIYGNRFILKENF